MNLDELTLSDLTEGRSDLVKKIKDQSFAEVMGEIGELKTKLAEAEAPPEVTVEWLEAEHAEVIAEAVEAARTSDSEGPTKTERELQAKVDVLQAKGREMESREILRNKLAESDLGEAGKKLVQRHFKDAAPENMEAFAKDVGEELEAIGKALSESRAPGVPALAESAPENFDIMADIAKAAGVKEEDE